MIIHLIDYVPVNTTSQIIIIWCIAAIATISVVSGLKLGIRRLSELRIAVGMFLMLIILFIDDTSYFVNLYVQSIGNYMQNIVQLSFHTDAFAELENASDHKENSDWMNAWTIFY